MSAPPSSAGGEKVTDSDVSDAGAPTTRVGADGSVLGDSLTGDDNVAFSFGIYYNCTHGCDTGLL